MMAMSDTASFRGDVIFTRETGPNNEPLIRITHAAPVTLIGDEILVVARLGDTRWVSLDEDAMALTVSDDFGQRYVYRLDRHIERYGYWEASWPD